MAAVAALIVIPVDRLLRETGRPPALAVLAVLALCAPFGLLMSWLARDAQRCRDDGWIPQIAPFEACARTGR